MHLSKRYSLAAATLAAVSILVSGCQSAPPVIPEDAGPSAAGGGEYRIGAGDLLEIFVWRNPEISTEVTVRPDGRISMPLVDDIQAEGTTPTALASSIETILAEYIRSPEVNVIVKSFVGTFGDQIRVVGQAPDPQAVSYRANMTLLDVMIEVGGLGPFAAGNRSKVIRTINGEKIEIKVRLDDLINRGQIKHNIPMRPGDVVIIPESIF